MTYEEMLKQEKEIRHGIENDIDDLAECIEGGICGDKIVTPPVAQSCIS